MAEESLNSVKVFWLDQDRLLTEVHKVAVRVGQADENIRKIILFGSLAEKRAVPGSDADILIVLQKDSRAFMDRISGWSGRFIVDFPVEVFPYTREELNNTVALKATCAV